LQFGDLRHKRRGEGGVAFDSGDTEADFAEPHSKALEFVEADIPPFKGVSVDGGQAKGSVGVHIDFRDVPRGLSRIVEQSCVELGLATVSVLRVERGHFHAFQNKFFHYIVPVGEKREGEGENGAQGLSPSCLCAAVPRYQLSH